MHYFEPKGFVIRAQGEDAERYLQSRLSNNIKALARGEHCFAASLNHQGKPQGYFCVLHNDENEYLLVADGEAQEEIVAGLMQFKVADRVEAEILADTSILHITGDLPQGAEKYPTIQRTRATTPGHDILCPKGEIETLITSELTKLEQEAQVLERIKSGAVQFPDEIDPNKILTESGAREAVSFRKGCYLGQEVLEKIDSHGRAPSRLATRYAEGEHTYESGQELLGAEKKKVGTVVSSAYDNQENKTYTLVRLKNTDASTGKIFTQGVELHAVQNLLSEGNN